MAKSGISIGDDTPTGEPQNGPRGPYIEADTDDATVVPDRGGQDPTRAAPGGSRTETKIAEESALGSDDANTAAETSAASGSCSSGPPRPSKLKPDMPDELAKRRPKGPAQP